MTLLLFKQLYRELAFVGKNDFENEFTVSLNFYVRHS